MSENIPLKTSEPIEYGRASTFEQADNIYGYLMTCFNSADAIVDEDSTHPWVTLLSAFRDVFGRVRDESFTLSPAGLAFVDEIGMMNLGRLARIRHDGEGYVYSVSQIGYELIKCINGNPCTSLLDVSGKYVPIAKWIVGGQLDGFIGAWNSTKYKPADDILAGCIIVLCYVMFWWTGFLKQYMKLIKKLGTFSSIDGTLRGNYRPLDVSKPETWGSLLLAQENLAVNQFPEALNTHTMTYLATGLSFFGLDTAAVDDPVLRGVTVSIYTHANAFWDKLLTRSQWEWRHAKFVSFETLFFPQFISCSDLGESGDGQDAEVDMWDSFQLFSADAGDFHNNWRWFNWFVNDTITMFKDFYFKNASFAKIKALFSVIPFSSVPVPPESGIGGLLVHQFMHWEDGGADVDICSMKGILDTDHSGHRVLCNRRASDTNFRFMTIGDITIQDYRMFNALTAMNYVSVDHGISSAETTYDEPPLVALNAFAHVILKTEDLPYRIDRRIGWLFGDASEDMAFEYANGTANDHPAINHAAIKTWVQGELLTTEFPISSIATKPVFYFGRASDPYKKLKHDTHDMNHLDADLVRKDMLSLFWPSGGSSIKESPVVVSAFAKPEGEVVGGMDPMVDKKDLQPVSSVASAQKSVTEAKKEVTKAEKELSVEKKKEA